MDESLVDQMAVVLEILAEARDEFLADHEPTDIERAICLTSSEFVPNV